MISVAATTLDEQCHSLYEKFLQSKTYDQAGEPAWQMMELNCWPELQGMQKTKPSPTNWDCNSLGTYIMQDNPDSGWAKVYESKSVAYWNLESGVKPRSSNLRIDPKSSAYARAMNTASTSLKHKIQVINNAEAPPGGTRKLECLAEVRTNQGYQTVYYYLDNDGSEEWWGYLYLRN